MQVSLVIFVIYLSCSSCRVELGDGVTPILQDRPKLHMECSLRSLEGDAYPSVIVRWLGELHRLTWDSKGEVRLDMNFKYQPKSHGYPSSGGLSGDSTTAKPADPFKDAPVVPDYHVVDDIVDWFARACKRPY